MRRFLPTALLTLLSVLLAGGLMLLRNCFGGPRQKEVRVRDDGDAQTALRL